MKSSTFDIQNYSAEGEDFRPSATSSLTLSSRELQACALIPIINDIIFEEREDFQVLLRTSDENVAFDSDRVVVAILDEDSQFNSML